MTFSRVAKSAIGNECAKLRMGNNVSGVISSEWFRGLLWTRSSLLIDDRIAQYADTRGIDLDHISRR